MSLSYRITFFRNGCRKLIIHQKALYDIFFMKKLVKWCYSRNLLHFGFISIILASNDGYFNEREYK